MTRLDPESQQRAGNFRNIFSIFESSLNDLRKIDSDKFIIKFKKKKFAVSNNKL